MTQMINETIKVDGMSCDHCRNAIESALAKLNGVTTAEVNLEKSEVRVDYDENRVSVDQMKQAIEDQGYDVK
ncbi:copper chaperone [Staphylococcus devriesei]|uniref:Copper chaperone CopZ n=2 Tax=Staphylococcus devriesei TaxID=586733 RepID=A0A2K4DQW7_9STAP|nr:copper resistance protein CopZ [Staphylococcus devriesei]PTE73686.1 copper chaperone [Staphylococcus devriesei]PTF02633.1 copper chaperone [Staphylococcus devriesei]PTF15103.1 copper chaperone [Staphylococcus devriesei]PTF16808.1 copper chaperone [Staphylococcus devriesei]